MMNDDIIVLDESAKGTSSEDLIEPAVREIDNGKKVMTLKFPVTIKLKIAGGSEKEEVISELTFRRPNGSDMRAVEKIASEQERGIKMFIRVADISDFIFDKLDLEDIQAGMEVVADFLPKSPRTGLTS